MATTYRPAEQEVNELLSEVIQATYPDLVKADVTVSILMAHSDEEGKPALKKNGYPCAALIKVNSYQDRIEGKADATVKIDSERWEELNDAEQRALLDHELRHLSLQLDDQGAPKTDDAGRPKLKSLAHDVEIGLFFDVVERHGKAALEAQAYHNLGKEFTQRNLFPWG